MIYASFAAVGGHIYSYAILAVVWCSLFLLNMLAKDESLAKKPEWTDYK